MNKPAWKYWWQRRRFLESLPYTKKQYNNFLAGATPLELRIAMQKSPLFREQVKASGLLNAACQAIASHQFASVKVQNVVHALQDTAFVSMLLRDPQAHGLTSISLRTAFTHSEAKSPFRITANRFYKKTMSLWNRLKSAFYRWIGLFPRKTPLYGNPLLQSAFDPKHLLPEQHTVEQRRQQEQPQKHALWNHNLSGQKLSPLHPTPSSIPKPSPEAFRPKYSPGQDDSVEIDSSSRTSPSSVATYPRQRQGTSARRRLFNNSAPAALGDDWLSKSDPVDTPYHTPYKSWQNTQRYAYSVGDDAEEGSDSSEEDSALEVVGLGDDDIQVSSAYLSTEVSSPYLTSEDEAPQTQGAGSPEVSSAYLSSKEEEEKDEQQTSTSVSSATHDWRSPAMDGPVQASFSSALRAEPHSLSPRKQQPGSLVHTPA